MLVQASRTHSQELAQCTSSDRGGQTDGDVGRSEPEKLAASGTKPPWKVQ